MDFPGAFILLHDTSRPEALPSLHDIAFNRSLVAPVRDLLAVRAVWHDTSVEQATQRFVIWAAKLLESRHEVAQKLEACGIGGPRSPLPRSLLLHCELGGQAVELVSSRTLVQVDLCTAPLFGINTGLPASAMQHRFAQTALLPNTVAPLSDNSLTLVGVLPVRRSQHFPKRVIMRISPNRILKS